MGCTTVATVKPNQPLVKGESLAFGRFLFNLRWRGLLTLYFNNIATKKSYSIKMNDRSRQGLDWYFVMSLPPGNYRTTKITQMGLMESEIDFFSNFTVPESGSVYLGTLNYQERNTRSFLYIAGRHDIYISVTNDRYAAVDYLTKKGYLLGDNIVESIFSGGSLDPQKMDKSKMYGSEIGGSEIDPDPLAPIDTKQFQLNGSGK